MSAVEEVAPTLQLPGFNLAAIRRDAASAPRASAALVSRQQWERRYRALLRVTDTAIALTSCVLATVLSLLATAPHILTGDPWLLVRVPLTTAVVWLIALSLFNTREPAIMGTGVAEYKRVAHATGLAFGSLAIVYVIFQWEGIRTQLFFALPAGIVALILSRWACRKFLIWQREFGRYTSRTVVVGSRDDVEYAIRTLGPGQRLGYDVVGATVLDDESASLTVDARTYPVVHGPDAAARAAFSLHADTILVASQPAADPNYIKRLAWELEGTASELVICSRIADVAGPRMSLRPVDGMPLVHVKIPTFEGGAHVIKRGLDIVTAFAALTLLTPVALVIAVAIRLDSPGRVFFQQARVGRDGRVFNMLKFRSMRLNAEAELGDLADSNEGSGPLFKLKDDPRVTKVGRVLRRFSLDELPQFWNVLRGDMSVVGPRPPLPSEVQSYDGTVYRRLYIKPGITGPWQVGGRSDLTWEESVRLDLRYVENWSVMSDLVLMWRTAKAMVKPAGAY
ncbi:sugar transferase [Microbacterium terricola]|uniref:Polyprenyl glycosylphosphotransferase n=1 Tax=Microbacterium terricola TaxID=344163 RepID=A0ABM8DV87_9MICO|nr:sugar transferase [Microbacterium terricola]UYK39722.1 sugar transferase [Microbacterium terricola]BDV29532.1 polyprenyl glycosylphosphotransferase [Microbacterium terricola]